MYSRAVRCYPIFAFFFKRLRRYSLCCLLRTARSSACFSRVLLRFDLTQIWPIVDLCQPSGTGTLTRERRCYRRTDYQRPCDVAAASKRSESPAVLWADRLAQRSAVGINCAALFGRLACIAPEALASRQSAFSHALRPAGSRQLVLSRERDHASATNQQTKQAKRCCDARSC